MTGLLRLMSQALGGQPGFEEGGGFGAFDAVAGGVEDAAAGGLLAVERQPVGEMQIERNAFDRQVGVAQFEEALLEDYSQDFFAEECLRLLVAQICRKRVSCLDLNECFSRWRSRELEEVEGAFDGVDGEEAGLVFAAEVVVDAVEVEGDVEFGDALEWAEAESAENRSRAEGGEFLEGGGLRDFWF